MMTEKKQTKIAVAEFFYSIQGEGKTMGVPAIFLRLGGCNLFCGVGDAKWRCDSIEVWQNSTTYTIDLLLETLNEGLDLYSKLQNDVHLIVTGGEPLQQQKALAELFEKINKYVPRNLFIEIETNGTILPTPEVDKYVNLYNVSPKLSNSGEPHTKRMNLPALDFFNYHTDNSIFKFVINDEGDIQEFITEWLAMIIDDEKVWLMPASDTREMLQERSEWLIQECLKLELKFSSRLQLQIWNKKTGV